MCPVFLLPTYPVYTRDKVEKVWNPSSRRTYTDRMAEPSPQPQRRSLLDIPSQDISVGRQREMSELRRAVDDPLSGQGRLVMLAGEPGISKTRTAQELMSHAENGGARVR